MASIVLQRTIYRCRVVFLESNSEQCFELTNNGVDIARKMTIRADIARRLRRVCTHLPEAEFQSLVDDMTDRQLSGERRTNDFWA